MNLSICFLILFDRLNGCGCWVCVGYMGCCGGCIGPCWGFGGCMGWQHFSIRIIQIWIVKTDLHIDCRTLIKIWKLNSCEMLPFSSVLLPVNWLHISSHTICSKCSKCRISLTIKTLKSQVLVDRTSYDTPCRGTAHQFIFLFLTYFAWKIYGNTDNQGASIQDPSPSTRGVCQPRMGSSSSDRHQEAGECTTKGKGQQGSS